MGHNLKFLIITIIAISLTDVLAARTYSRRVVLGDERFEEYQPLLQGKRVAVFSNQTGIVGDKVTGSKLADALAEYGWYSSNLSSPSTTLLDPVHRTFRPWRKD